MQISKKDPEKGNPVNTEQELQDIKIAMAELAELIAMGGTANG